MDLSLKPSEGLGVLHLFCKYQSSVDSEKVKKTVSESLDKGIQVVVAVMLGHKADLALMVLGEDLWDLRDFQSSIDSSIVNNWSFGDDSTSIEYEPTHIYKYPGDYTVCLIAGNEFNCFDTSCLEITIFPNEIIIPNIFSPNNDVVNDEFVIYGINDLFDIKIYNRWGNLVFDQNPYENNWNGENSNGKKLSEGQYFYILKNNQEQIKLNGSVMLVR